MALLLSAGMAKVVFPPSVLFVSASQLQVALPLENATAPRAASGGETGSPATVATAPPIRTSDRRRLRRTLPSHMMDRSSPRGDSRSRGAREPGGGRARSRWGGEQR